MSNTTFKVGDLVYFPTLSTKVYTLSGTSCGCYIVRVDDDGTFTKDGKLYDDDNIQRIFHATEENRELLSKLYGVEFEAPPKKLTGSDLTRKLLADGAKYVLCYVGDHGDPTDSINPVDVIEYFHVSSFISCYGTNWKYATPIKVLDNIDVMDGSV